MLSSRSLSAVKFRWQGREITTFPKLWSRPISESGWSQPRASNGQTLQPPCRFFHGSAALSKQKGGKQDAKKNIEKAKGTAQAANNDPHDFSELEGRIKEAHTIMKDELSKLRPGGQFNPQLLEALKVSVKGGGSNKEMVRLEDIATVVPKTARQIMIMVSEQELMFTQYVKPVSSAILSSQYNMNPAPSHTNPLELILTVPPPTAESRKMVLEAADNVGEKTLHTIRQARGEQQKKLNAMTKIKSVTEDDLKRSRARMEKLVEDSNKTAKDMLRKARSALEK